MTDSKWEFWNALAKEWKKVLEEYILGSSIVKKDGKNLPNDLPYWHGQKAITGFLAVAAWRIGAIALQESFTERPEQKNANCHYDLWVKYNNFSFAVEARLLWGNAEYGKDKIVNEICEAEKQLKTLSNEDKEASGRLFSICYICPLLQDKGKFGECLRNVVNYFKEQDYQVYHYDGSYLDDNIINYNKNKPEEKWPGVIMLVKDSTSKCK